MESTCTSIITHNTVSEFISCAMTRFSQWSGVNIGYLFNMLEISANENECLDIIEDCLREFGKLESEPDEYPWQIIPEGYNRLSSTASIIQECNTLLNELEEIRARIKGDLFYD